MWKSLPEGVEKKSGAGGKDPSIEQAPGLKQCVWLAPTSERKKGVRAGKKEQFSIQRQHGAEASEGVDGVVGGVGLGSVDSGGLEPSVGLGEELDHGKAVMEGSSALRLKWLPPGRGEKNPIQGETVSRGPCNAEMAGVGWVEGAAEEGKAHGWIVVGAFRSS